MNRQNADDDIMSVKIFLPIKPIMIKRILTILPILFILSITRVYAGWYECYNFNGTINKYPISLSVQVFNRGYFGEPDKKAFNLIGVYKYDNHNEPINLEGKLDYKNNKVLLYEISNKKHTASFEFEFSETECNGVWTNLATNKQLPLHLNYVSKLTDTAETDQFSNIQILQNSSLKDLYFVGIYSKTAGEKRAQMDKLKIIRKKDNSIFQVIDFSEVDTQTGNVWTIIFGNVEILNAITNELQVWNNIGKMGGLLTIKFSPKTQKFKLNPNPIPDGPN
jgi:hypothetical protein